MAQLRRTLFGNPILRQTARRLSGAEILSDEIQQLIHDMQFTLENRQYGVGLAAPQVGQSVALSIIGIKPSPTRPKVTPVKMVIINPKIIMNYGEQTELWEGCISLGNGPDAPYAKVPRYEKVRVAYQDESAQAHERDFNGLLAHILQHEIDHLNGVLFVDSVKDMKTFITRSEFKKRYVKTLKPNE
jgi:peptide deformylase